MLLNGKAGCLACLHAIQSEHLSLMWPKNLLETEGQSSLKENDKNVDVVMTKEH